jgi:ABC-type glycerol-3-phosphate transport system permease component
MYTVTQGLAAAGHGGGVYVGVALAAAVMAILPVIVLFLLLQRYIVRGFIGSGVKG